jgi:hypothetical protein
MQAGFRRPRRRQSPRLVSSLSRPCGTLAMGRSWRPRSSVSWHPHRKENIMKRYGFAVGLLAITRSPPSRSSVSTSAWRLPIEPSSTLRRRIRRTARRRCVSDRAEGGVRSHRRSVRGLQEGPRRGSRASRKALPTSSPPTSSSRSTSRSTRASRPRPRSRRDRGREEARRRDREEAQQARPAVATDEGKRELELKEFNAVLAGVAADRKRSSPRSIRRALTSTRRPS